jgi:uncharacterized protein
MSPASRPEIPIEKRNSRHGLGAHALVELPKGAVVIPGWTRSFYDGMDGWIRLRRREVLRLAPDQRALFLRYGLDHDFDQIVGPIHIGVVTTADNFINHSCDPNLGFDHLDNVVAARQIRAGEEVLVDYGCFIVNFDETFECRCGSPNCRLRIRRRDWMRLAKKHGMNMPRFLHGRIARWLHDRDHYGPRRNPAPLVLRQHRASQA